MMIGTVRLSIQLPFFYVLDQETIVSSQCLSYDPRGTSSFSFINLLARTRQLQAEPTDKRKEDRTVDHVLANERKD